MKKIFFSNLIIFYICLFTKSGSVFSQERADLTIIGNINLTGSMGRFALGIIDCLKNDLKINFIKSSHCNYNGISNEIINIVQDSGAENFGKVTLLVDAIAWPKANYYPYKLLSKDKSESIRIAWSIFETTKVPQIWVDILNNEFDAVAVMDEFLKPVYQNSGVRIPIFVLPLGMYLNEFLSIKNLSKPSKPFVFGYSPCFHPRKNHEMLIKAFIEEFGNSQKVLLRLKGLPYGRNDFFKKLKNDIEKLNIRNIELESTKLSMHDYLYSLTSIDCYVSLSKGEGYSMIPREMLALGIPCILTNNTGQTNICNSGYVKIVESKIPEEASYPELFGNEQLGYFYNCELDNIRKAMRDVYSNYSKYLSLAKKGREWVKKYRWENLKNNYLNIIKPKKLFLGDDNIVNNDYLMTNSFDLYMKYKKLL